MIKKNYLSLYFIILILPLLKQIPGSAIVRKVNDLEDENGTLVAMIKELENKNDNCMKRVKQMEKGDDKHMEIIKDLEKGKRNFLCVLCCCDGLQYC
jgi:hypothetical protein